jgi:hypothetical protein
MKMFGDRLVVLTCTSGCFYGILPYFLTRTIVVPLILGAGYYGCAND